VLNFVEAPLADVPEPFGLTLAEASTTLSTLVTSPRFAGLTVTEINPDHLPDEEILPKFTRMLADALLASLRVSRPRSRRGLRWVISRPTPGEEQEGRVRRWAVTSQAMMARWSRIGMSLAWAHQAVMTLLTLRRPGVEAVRA
jgi:hypothetical protein